MEKKQRTAKEVEDHNRIYDIRPDSGETPKGVSSDMIIDIHPRTAGSDEMAPSKCTFAPV